MNCRSARKRIPDFAGRAPDRENARRLQKHLRNCEACRADEAAFRAGIEALKKPDIAGEMDFTEAEWTAAIRAAVMSPQTVKSGRFFPVFRPAFAYGLGILLVGTAVLFGVRRFPWLVPVVENQRISAAVMARLPDSPEPINRGFEAGKKGPRTRGGKGTVSPEFRPSPVPSPKPPQPAGDVPSFTWISEETGLQVVWFVNDNLELEE